MPKRSVHEYSRVMQRLLFLAGAMASACSDTTDATDLLQPGSGDEVGSGTRTLRVEASVLVTDNEGQLHPYFMVWLWKDDVPVTDANVTITSRTDTFVLGSDVRFPGRWTNSAPNADGYDHVYVLDVHSGVDTIRSVRVEGPPSVVFTSPAENSRIDPSLPIEIQWEPRTADELSLIINPQGTLFGQIDDDGSFTIPANSWVSNPAGSHAVGLTRKNTVTPAGADDGSWMSVSTEDYLHVCDRPSTGLCTD